jgi:inner membrane transporter RhtA
MSQSPVTLNLHSGQNPAAPLKIRARFGRDRVPSMPPTVMILLAVLSVQIGAAVAKSLFGSVGPSGVVLMRVGLAAIMLLIIWRKALPNRALLTGGNWKNYLPVVWLGITIGVMNLSFYQALSRLPLGVAVAIEFIGPLTLALFGSRRWLDALWVVLAAVGIILLTPFDGKGLDIIGIGFALVAAACWAGYIVLGAKTGRTLPGGAGLALAMGVAAVVALPFGVASGGAMLLEPSILLIFRFR